MDFTLDDEQEALQDLVARMAADLSNPEKLKEQEVAHEPIDWRLWEQLAGSGLLGLTIPEEHGGAGRTFLDAAVVLVELGRRTARVPYLPAVAASLAIARHGTPEQAAALLGSIAAGERLVTVALAESATPVGTPLARASSAGTLDGQKHLVPAGTVADVFLISAQGPDGPGLYVVEAGAPGLMIEAQETIFGVPEARLTLTGTPGEALGQGGSAALGELIDHYTAGLCALGSGVCQEAVRLTAEYTKTRNQFGRPIASFQAVGQRAADAYIDAQAVRLTALQAAWRLAQGLPAHREVAIAKFWVADGGQRVVHAAQHLHGGMGVDRDYPLHRYFLWAKQLELTLGGSTAQLLDIGAELAATPRQTSESA